MNRHLLLIGFMGTGKTSVSERLHQMLGTGQSDTDRMIEEREGMSISRIFEEKGEAYFRNAETRLLGELTAMKPMVISCGGGMALRPGNAALMKAAGTVVLLTARPQTILERLKDDDTRPLLAGRKDADYIRTLYESRRPAYEAAADIQISTDGRSIEDICQEIAEKIKKSC